LSYASAFSQELGNLSILFLKSNILQKKLSKKYFLQAEFPLTQPFFLFTLKIFIAKNN